MSETAASRPPTSDDAALAWPEMTRATTGSVPVLSRTAHDRAHLARNLPDPTGGRPVRC